SVTVLRRVDPSSVTVLRRVDPSSVALRRVDPSSVALRRVDAEERGGTQRKGTLSANLCTAIGQLVRKLRGFRGQTQETDRIMARQNHAEQKQNSCWQAHKRRGRMILSGHESVFFHLVAAWRLCVFAFQLTGTSNQFSIFNPTMRSKCRVLRVTRVQS